MKLFMSGVVAFAFALAACNDNAQTAANGADSSASQDSAKTEAAAAPAPGATLTPEDPGGLTEDGFIFHTRPGAKHIVRLPSPGTDTWRAASSGDPTVKQTSSRKDVTADGKPALIFEYEMLQAGNAAIQFERLEDGEVEGKRTITFEVQ
jgi:hypothetical protein